MFGCQTVVATVIAVALAIALWHFWLMPSSLPLCWNNYATDGATVCRPQCNMGYFSLSTMEQCHPWLTCREIESEDFKVLRSLGSGAVKMVYLATWNGREVAYSTLQNQAYVADFRHGMNMLISFQPDKHVTQLIGQCGDSFVTEYHSFGTANNLNALLTNTKYERHNTINNRFRLCLAYVEILTYLHNSPTGTRVMCDSNDLEKTLDQFLLTGDLGLVGNDLDALPLVNQADNVTIKCGHKQLLGDFVAPEQLWPLPERDFVDQDMPGYDEKTDIWKIPEVCDYFLGESPRANSVKFRLFKVHNQCKINNPVDRPTALSLLEQYKQIQTEMNLF